MLLRLMHMGMGGRRIDVGYGLMCVCDCVLLFVVLFGIVAVVLLRGDAMRARTNSKKRAKQKTNTADDRIFYVLLFLLL